jgi:acetyl-CoA carboxylase biotin carboxyl carrier protein
VLPEELTRYAALMEARGLVELEVREGDFHLKLSRKAAGVPVAVAAAPSAEAPPPPVAAPAPKAPEAHVIVSPLAGILYRAPAPNAPPFVKEGDRVAFGDMLCIVEAMKVMNEIRSDQPGVVRKILGQNGKPVSAGQEIFQIDPLP